jgi:hypothetical protein
VSWWDVFVEMATRSLSTVPPARQDRARLCIHINTDRGIAELTNGVVLPDVVRDLLLCDATVQPVWETNSFPDGVGRSSRDGPGPDPQDC